MNRFLVSLAALACYGAVAAGELSTEAQAAREHAIRSEFNAAKERCRHVEDRKLRDLCKVQAHASRRVALAELQVLAAPSEASERRLARTQAETAFGVENQRCLLLQGQPRGECRRQARARLVQQMRALASAEPMGAAVLQPSQRVKLATPSRGVWKPLTGAATSA